MKENNLNSTPVQPENIVAPTATPAPKPQNNSILVVLSILLIVLVGFVAFLAYQNFQLRKQITSLQTNSSPIPTATDDPTTGWETYTNTKFNYSLKYPTGYIAGQNGININDIGITDFLLVYYKNNPDKPRFAVSVWPKTQENSLEKLANDHYKKVSAYQLPAGFSLYQGMNNEAVKTISQGTFMDKKSFGYTIKGNYIEDGAAEYITPIQNHLYIWLESGNNIFLISLDDEVTMNQILSTFKFLGESTISNNQIILIDNVYKYDASGNQINGNPVKFVLNLPEKFKLLSGGNSTSVSLGGSTFTINGRSGGSGGPCPMDNSDPSCGYNDENFSSYIKTLRIWKNKNGVFMLNPQNISIQSYILNNIIITKDTPNSVFSDQEISDWKSALNNITIVPQN